MHNYSCENTFNFINEYKTVLFFFNNSSNRVQWFFTKIIFIIIPEFQCGIQINTRAQLYTMVLQIPHCTESGQYTLPVYLYFYIGNYSYQK